jgi:hypothetical protein
MSGVAQVSLLRPGGMRRSSDSGSQGVLRANRAKMSFPPEGRFNALIALNAHPPQRNWESLRRVRRPMARSLVGCMKRQEDADGCSVLLRFAIALDADSSAMPLDELLRHE